MESRGIFQFVFSSCRSGARHGKKLLAPRLNVGMFGGVGSRREGFFFHYRSMKFEMLINDECRDVDLTVFTVFQLYTAQQYNSI